MLEEWNVPATDEETRARLKSDALGNATLGDVARHAECSVFEVSCWAARTSETSDIGEQMAYAVVAIEQGWAFPGEETE